MIAQTPTLILPTNYGAGTGTLASTETVADVLEHTSIDIPVWRLQEKQAHIMATEIVAAGIPGPLWVWVELSPYPTTNNLLWPSPYPASAAYWGAIGGGGGALVPIAPTIEAGTGVNGTVHNFFIPWNQHSAWARVVIQTPVLVATAFWVVQVLFSGKD